MWHGREFLSVCKENPKIQNISRKFTNLHEPNTIKYYKIPPAYLFQDNYK